jgi:actin-related protein
VVIDNGTGYTKMGYAGNKSPTFDIPTLITEDDQISPNKQGTFTSHKKICPNLDFVIG